MLLDTREMISVTEANQNFSRATRIADQRGIHNTCLNGIIDSFERVRILSVSYDEPTFSPRLSLGYEVI